VVRCAKAVGRGEPRTAGLSTQDRQLVPQNQDLQLLRATRAGQQAHEREQVPTGERLAKELAGARLPREASPAKVAKDGQHNDDDDDDPKPGRHVILSLGACRLYDEPTRIRKVYGPMLRWERLALWASANASRARMRAMHAGA
jgi:hypothetical protein